MRSISHALDFRAARSSARGNSFPRKRSLAEKHSQMLRVTRIPCQPGKIFGRFAEVGLRGQVRGNLLPLVEGRQAAIRWRNGHVARTVKFSGADLSRKVDELPRFLEFEKIEQGAPIEARCSDCDRLFRVSPKPGDRTDDLLLRLRAEFESHDCAKSRNTR